jgi:hypothetical protein
MRRAITQTLATIFMALVVLGLATTARAGEPQGCSNATLRGSFGFTSQGALLAGVPPPVVGPFGEVGRQIFDGRGNTEGTATLSANGNIVRVTFYGTYVVNPDCTGSMSLYVSPIGTTAELDFVIDDNGTELRAIVTAAGTVETRVYRKQVSRERGD